MVKYIIEGNINFQEELYKMLDQDSDNEDELCQISGLPLKDKYVTLECNHHFNYDALYKEIYNQIYVFKTYNVGSLTRTELNKFRESKMNYFIKCPYCRNIQFTILPYYKELGLDAIYGINSLDSSKPNSHIIHNPGIINNSNHIYTLYGVTFKMGTCCEKISGFGDKCMSNFVGTIPNTTLSYCSNHYRNAIRCYKLAEKKKILDAKLLAKKEKTDLLEKINTERAAKGLKLLVRLPIQKKNIENTIEQGQTIQQYVPDETEVINGCKALLKTGQNKGRICGCKKLEEDGFCKRHSKKDNKTTNEELHLDKDKDIDKDIDKNVL